MTINRLKQCELIRFLLSRFACLLAMKALTELILSVSKEQDLHMARLRDTSSDFGSNTVSFFLGINMAQVYRKLNHLET